ncbi:MAG: tetratricopeptide repeat protein [Candidatus Omnitrophota bacterium]|jgi:tetratricopeptide (TPR) repeat protein
MRKILFMAAGGIFLVFLLSVGIGVYSRNTYLSGQLGQLNKMVQKAQEELATMQAEREKVMKENERLQNDSMSYLAVNTKLQDEKGLLQINLQEAQRLIGEKEDYLRRAQSQLGEMKEELKKSGNYVQTAQKAQQGLLLLQKHIKQERAVYNYNLGVAYTSAKYYDEAVTAYLRSLELNPSNPDAHYNLAVVYDTIKQDPEKAVEHYRKYLELKPGADDADDIREALKRLKE